jgi:hypothetical protein
MQQFLRNVDIYQIELCYIHEDRYHRDNKIITTVTIVEWKGLAMLQSRSRVPEFLLSGWHKSLYSETQKEWRSSLCSR